jgi:hypothetical protein
VEDNRPVTYSVPESIREWFAHAAAHGVLWEVEFFCLEVTSWRGWEQFFHLQRLWPHVH